MWLGFAAIVLTDSALYLIIRMADARAAQRNEELSLRYTVLLLVFCCFAHYAATLTMGRAAETDLDRWKVLAASVGFGIIPVSAYVRALFRNPALSRAAATRDAMETARQKRLHGDTDGALREYLRCFEDDPTNVDALFAAAAMLRDEKRYDQAATLLHKIKSRFHVDSAAYRKAEARLVHLLDDLARARGVR